ncbi:type I-F CRISPR-associated helicase Cas3f [Methylomonas methanica]|uniref:CRISPR-associated helicase Cas3 family n=1 Tax=Methylomonas methanica (strain DSM 25384 / MC09) TaxID=857087 RepID=F9ZYW4_METMM|nr:type I-F CRISPR-associated helicase Cas3f [Methylomonas methanica]AEF99819.1 CRISPR-associated helicase Cas3 family [Methylomonas methanica MC09]
MMVTFVSQCQKKALARTRRVLDAFANRIGDNTWQTGITEEGLQAVKKLLRKTATKSTAVSCHWLRSRSRSELVWIVGNRRCFNSEGIVPVNTTQKSVLKNEWENDWHYLPVIKALVAVAALLHDWGKATALFQSKLKSGTRDGDPLRHEWISCLLLNALVKQAGNTDDGWLQLLTRGALDEQAIKQQVLAKTEKPLDDLPPTAQLVGWLILSHHRLPLRSDPARDSNQARESMARMLKSIAADWGYQNKVDDALFEKRLPQCFDFPAGLLSQSSPWLKQLQKWSARLSQAQPQIQELLDNGAYRLALHHARLCLMLGDHYYSSLAADHKWQTTIDLIANTDKDRKPKQKLDEHLVRVCEQALRISQNLSRFSTDMEPARDVKKLKQKSPPGYQWQDKAVDKIAGFKKQHETLSDKGYGWFIVNMASTGCGKTVANAKIMRALSDDGDSLRFVLALGLRTLTLQTGDEYRNLIGMGKDDLAVLIGSSAVQELHNQAKRDQQTEPSFEESGSESLELLLGEELNYETMPTAEFLDAVLRHDKHKAFLYKPVLACTIDHIIAATETRRGGKYILPCLRLLSSDLVIDEVDDFDGKDLIAIGRLIQLAGMLGRKVMISSATIPPALAEGYFHVYQAGWQLHSRFKSAHPQIACAWVDEFATEVQWLERIEAPAHYQPYRDAHQAFIEKRVEQLLAQPVKRKARIVRCDELLAEKKDQAARQRLYFEIIQQTAIELHRQHHTIDAKTGKSVSFGVVRMANIPPCVAVSQFLLDTVWPEGTAPKVMAYHSRQVLLLRHEQEKHLDAVLKRKESANDQPQAFSNTVIRQHLDSTSAQHVLFILVATPVEEVGRDHDFDWAVIEPSSYRSIIQMAGRVRRHRPSGVEQPNIAILQYNLKALRRDGKPAYCRPGYELPSLKLEFHDLCQLVDEAALNAAINAVPRIRQPENLRPKQQLADLEHQVMGNQLTGYHKQGPIHLQAWVAEAWWLTAVPQQLNRFRDSAPDISLYRLWQDGDVDFFAKNERGEFMPYAERRNIKNAPPSPEHWQQRLWMVRNYAASLARGVAEKNPENEQERQIEWDSKRYGEITFPDNKDQSFLYSDQFGLYPRDI